MTYSSVAIRVHSNALGYIESAFGFAQAPNPASFETIVRQGLVPDAVKDIKSLKESYLATPVVPSHKVESIVTLLGFVATLIAKEVEQNHRDTGPASIDPMEKATRFIERNFTDKLRLSTVARAAGFSDDYFSRLFRQATGVSFNDYVAQRRIAHAKELLLAKDKRISEVAFACGFESISHFNRSFKQYTSTSPKVYRNTKHRSR